MQTVSEIIPLIKSKFMDVNFNINLFLHFLILYTFLTIFFITFISKVSSDAFNGEVNHIIHNSKLHETIDQNPTIGEALENVPLDVLSKMYSKPDQAVTNYNEGLFNACIISTVLLWISFIVIVLILKFQCDSELKIGKIIIENAIIFTAIGFAEYYFFTKIAIKFIPVEPSFIYKQFFETIKSKI